MAEQKRTTKKTPSKTPKATVEKAVLKKNSSLEAPVYTDKGVVAGNIKLPEAVFGLKWNNDLVHQVITSMLANKRAGTAHTKDRGEVRGGGKKPWKQKGTGRARHGSSRSPIWVGGGTTHGPRSEKDYSKKINKKMRAKALYTVLSQKYSDGNILLIEALTLSAPKTKDAAVVLSNLSKIAGFENVVSKKKTAVLIALPESTDALQKSFANLPGATLTAVANLSALAALNANRIVLVNPHKTFELLVQKLQAKN